MRIIKFNDLPYAKFPVHPNFLKYFRAQSKHDKILFAAAIVKTSDIEMDKLGFTVTSAEKIFCCEFLADILWGKVQCQAPLDINTLKEHFPEVAKWLN